LTQAKAVVEENIVNMLSSIIKEGEKRKKAIHLEMASLRDFFESCELLRKCEKKLIAEGFQDKHFEKQRNHYQELIKLFAQRS
jgi:hypothetical protein